MPVPAWLRAPAPPMALAAVSELLRLKTSVALFVTAPVPSEPVVPPLPTWSVPLPIVVAPV